jgi:hypothetical protein
MIRTLQSHDYRCPDVQRSGVQRTTVWPLNPRRTLAVIAAVIDRQYRAD